MERRQRLASLGELAAIVAHEMRTPLSTVRGYAQLLAERAEGADERARAPMEKIIQETDRLSHLAADLLTYGRPTPPRMVPVDLSRLVAETAERLGQPAAQRRVSVRCEAPEAMLAVADPIRLAQAFDNLVQNAVQASPAGETVTIRLERARGRAVVEVSDRGPGVPVESQEKIFEIFHTTRKGGTGLGLAVARRIADEHGGSLVYDGSSGWTVFRLTLPLER
jgi:two-component system sensor histidine kinase HydH